MAVEFNMGPLIRLQLATNPQHMRKVFKRWAVIYLSFAQQRFNAYSRGGGDWAPLAESTIRRRRKGSSTILRDRFGTLMRALSPNASAKGQLRKDLPNGIRVGYGGPANHPRGRATIADIAEFHQAGNPPRLPKREIIVKPDKETQNTMAGSVTKLLMDRFNGRG